MKPLEIAIAGCGPAGLCAALLLARDGHRVALFERFDAPRPVGSGLMIQPTGLAVLRELGLADALIAQGARIRRLRGETDKGLVVLDVRYAALNAAAFGLGVHRAALFGVLFDAVTKQAVPIETRKTVAGTEARADGRRSLVFAHGERSAPFDLVVDALGSSSPLCPASGRPLPYGALWASLDWPNGGALDTTALEQRYVGAHTMVGVMPMGLPDSFAANQAAFFWSLREDKFDEWRAGGLALWKDRVAALWPATRPLLDQIDDPERLIFARYRHRTLAHPAEKGLIHIGDAWRSTSPQLGQGANMALLDAYALAMAIRAEPDVESALARSVRARRAHVMTYQAMSRMFTPVYQSDSRMLPILRDRLVGPLSKVWPATTILAMIVSGLMAAPLRKLGLRTF